MKLVNDLAELSAPFRAAVEQLLEQLRAAGYEPLVFETYRTPERARWLVAQGKSRAKDGQSMHCYRVAADIICAKHYWACEGCGCDYYTQLGIEAAKLGLTWGGDWDGDGVTREQHEHDLPHVQGVPTSAQDAVRHAATLEIDHIVAHYLRTASG